MQREARKEIQRQRREQRAALLQEKREEDEAKRLQEAERHMMLNKNAPSKRSIKVNQGSFTTA